MASHPESYSASNANSTITMHKISPVLTVIVTKYFGNDSIPNTLSLMVDDVVQVLNQPNNNWWDGILVDPVGNVTRGWFPPSHTRPIGNLNTLEKSTIQEQHVSLQNFHIQEELLQQSPQNSASCPTSPGSSVYTKPNRGQRMMLGHSHLHNHSHGNLQQRKPSTQFNLPNHQNPTIKNDILGDTSSASIFKDQNIFAAKHYDSLASGSSYVNGDPFSMPSRQASQSLTEATSASHSNSFHLVSTEEISTYFQPANPITQPGFNFIPIWIPQVTQDDSIIYYNAALNIYSKDLPFLSAEFLNEDSVYEIPDTNKLSMELTTVPIVLKRENSFTSNMPTSENLNFEGSINTQQQRKQQRHQSSNSGTSDHLNARMVNENRNPLLFSYDNLYMEQGDIITWSSLNENFMVTLNNAISALKIKDKVTFKIALNLASEYLCSYQTCGRLMKPILKSKSLLTKFCSILQKLSSIFIQFVVNGNLYLMAFDREHSNDKTHEDYFTQIIKYSDKISKILDFFLSWITTLKLPDDIDSKILPVFYPRFVRNRFEGGNFHNKLDKDSIQDRDFFIDEQKKKAKLLLDDEVLHSLKSNEEKICSSLKGVKKILNSQIPKNVQINTFLEDRNLKLLTLIYHCIPNLTNYLNTLESIDFTVFAMIDKVATQNSERHNTIVDDTNMEDDDVNQSFYDATAKSLRPVLNEFNDLKQLLHSAFTDLILDSQTITADDPEVFLAMKVDEEEDTQNDEQKMSRTQIFANTMRKRLDQIDKDLFNDGLYISEPSLKLIETIKKTKEKMALVFISISQLKVQRQSILNYCSRLMNSDFNIASLFIAERHNTMVSTTSQSEFFYGRKKSDDSEEVPWFMDLDDNEKSLIYDPNGLKGGTFEGLVSKLVDALVEKDELFSLSMIILFITFTTPIEFFDLLIERFNISMPEALSYEEYGIWLEKKLKPQQQNVLSVFEELFSKYWLVHYSSLELIEKWREFTNNNSNISEDLISLGFKVIGFQDQEEYSKAFNLGDKEESEIPMSPLTPDIMKMRLKDLDIDLVARQITSIQAFYWRKIGLNDLLARSYNFNKIFKKKDAISTRNITNFIKNCNQLTHFTIYMILRRKDMEERVGMIEYFINLAEKLLAMKNFSSMTAVISGLGSTNISRLKKTWACISTEYMAKFEKMDNLMSIGKNYSEYRNILRFVETNGDAYLPFLGMYLSDLRFTTDGNSDVIHNDKSLINFSKRMNIMKIIREVLDFNEVKYGIPLDLDVVCYLLTIFDGIPDEERLYEMSLEIEPRISLLKNPSAVNLQGGSISSISNNSNNQGNAKKLSNVFIGSDSGVKSKHKNYRHLLSLNITEKEREKERDKEGSNLKKNTSGTLLNNGIQKKRFAAKAAYGV